MTSTSTTMSSTSTGITLGETGAVVYETIATTGTYILIAEGGSGAAGNGGHGGDGGIVTGTFSLTAGTTLEIVVGGDGYRGSGGGGGGGGSFIYDENTGILLEAGGGGGGGGYYDYGADGIAASATTAGRNGNGAYAGSGGTNGNGGGAGSYSAGTYGFNGGGGGGIRSNGGTSNTGDSGQGGSGGNLPGAQDPTTGVSVTLPGLGGGGFGGGGGVGSYGGGGGGGIFAGGGGGGYSGGGGGGGYGYTGGGGGGSFLATSPTNPTDLSATLSSAHFTATNTGNGKVIIAAMACFAEGTRILTADGRLVAVERLAAGDAVEIFDGTASEIIWVGRRRIDLTLHPRPDTARPIRIEAGALGGGLPWRDLIVSPDHGMYLNGHLIPAKILLNGGNIRQLDVPQVTYYHIELAQHAVLFAEGAPAESYLETGNRHAFENEAVTMMHPDFAQTKREAESCAPFVESGAVVEAVRQQILNRANIQTTQAPALEIQMREGAAHIISRSAIPGHLQADPRDQRRLGVKIAAISIGGEPLNLSHELLTQGWHDVEPDGRWTDGNAVIPAALVTGDVTVEFTATMTYRQRQYA